MTRLYIVTTTLRNGTVRRQYTEDNRMALDMMFREFEADQSVVRCCVERPAVAGVVASVERRS